MVVKMADMSVAKPAAMMAGMLVGSMGKTSVDMMAVRMAEMTVVEKDQLWAEW